MTALSGRGSGRPPGPIGFGTTRFDEPSPPSQAPIGVVVFSHPASTPSAPTPERPARRTLAAGRARLMPDLVLWMRHRSGRFKLGPDREVKRGTILAVHEKQIEIRWRDVDAYRHVNNAVYATYLEECRDELVDGLLGGSATPGTTSSHALRSTSGAS